MENSIVHGSVELLDKITKALDQRKPKVLGSVELLDRITRALDKQKPLSVISLGSTESYVMAQYTILSEEQFMNHKEAIRTNSGEKLRGFRFPNVYLRDEMVKAARKADIIGYNMHLRSTKAGLMTEKVFEAYRIRPRYVYEALIRRVIVVSQRKKFKRMLKERRIVLIGSIANDTKKAMMKRWAKDLQFDIVKCIPMRSYDEMNAVKRTLDKTEYDLALMCAGVNSVILAPYIATNHGKVGFDLGQGMESIITRKPKSSGFVEKVGVKKLMSL